MTSSTMVQHFKDAMALIIAAPVHLTGHYHAQRFSNGTFVFDENLSQSNCFCAVGALYRAIGRRDVCGPFIDDEYIRALGFNHEGDLIAFNDRSTKDEVLTRFAETINKLEKV